MTRKHAQHSELTEIPLNDLTTPCGVDDAPTPLLTGYYRPSSAPPPMPLRIIRHRGRCMVIDFADWAYVVEMRNSEAAPEAPIACVVTRMRHTDAVAAFARSYARALAAAPRQPAHVLADWLRGEEGLGRELGITVRSIERGFELSSGTLARRR